MATIGQQLTAPESGWRRYDDTDSRFNYSGTWSTATSTNNYNNTTRWTVDITANINFKFYGSKLRIIAGTNNTSSSNIIIVIDGIEYSYSNYSDGSDLYKILLFDISLQQSIHTVKISQNDGKALILDAIDIDDTGYLLHPILNQASDIMTMQVGDCIPCRYKAPTSGSVGTFSELGTCIADEIPVASSATPDGLLYLIHVGFDAKGRIKLVADRNVQHSITWDTLNNAGISTGEGLSINYDTSLPIVSAWTMDEKASNAANLTSSATPTYTGTTTGTDGSISYRTFNGTSDYISYSTKVVPLGKKSIRFKIRLAAGTFPTSAQILVCNAPDVTNYGMRIYLEPSNKSLNINLFNNTDGTGIGIVTTNAKVTLDDGKWHDILFTWDGTTSTNSMKLYADDMTTPVYQYTAKASETTAQTYNLFIGRHNNSAGLYFKGDLTIPEIYGELVDPASVLEPSIRTITGGTINDITDKFTGTCTGTTIVDTPNGKGRYFDGKNRITFSQTGIVPMGKKSIRVRLKRGSTLPTISERIIDQSISSKYCSFYFNTYGGLDFSIGDASVAPTVVATSLSYQQSICDNQWHEIVITWDGTLGDNKVKMYLDGIMVLQTSMATETSHVGGAFVIGDHATAIGSRYLKDTTIESLEIYSDVIDPAKPLTTNYYNQSVRLLTGGVSSTDKDNEWDKIIAESTLGGKITAGDNNIWKWNGICSWASSTPSTSANKVRRGSTATSYFNDTVASGTSGTATGFRPVLTIELLIKITIKYLLENEGNILALNPTYYGGSLPAALTPIGVSPASEQTFLDYGANDITILNSRNDIFDNLSNILKVLMFKKVE
jgi:hypothetical protein